MNAPNLNSCIHYFILDRLLNDENGILFINSAKLLQFKSNLLALWNSCTRYNKKKVDEQAD